MEATWALLHSASVIPAESGYTSGWKRSGLGSGLGLGLGLGLGFAAVDPVDHGQ